MSSADFLTVLAREYSRHSPHMEACGLTTVELTSQSAVIRLPYRDDWLGDLQTRRLNPGVITVLVDSTAGLAVLGYLGGIERIATLDLRIDYLRPAFGGDDVYCRASCYRMTQSIAFIRAEVWQSDPAEPIATAQLVFARGTGRSGAARGSRA